MATVKKYPGVWGIEVGQCAFKALRLEQQGDTPVATAFDFIEHPKILSQPDADPDQLTREALAKFLERNTVRGDTVVIGVPGQSGLARFVKLPPVEEKKISDIVRFEAKQQIPFPLEEVIWDFQKIGSGIVSDGFAMETEIGLFAMKRDMIMRSLQHFLEQNVEVHVIQMAPLALCNYIAYDLLSRDAKKGNDESSTGVTTAPDKTFKKKCVVVLDIGAEGSTLVITDGERIIWQRSIPPGGNHFTRALTKDLKLTFAKAEHLKRNATKSPDLKRILAALKPVLNEFVGEVQRSLNYFTNTHRDAHIEYMMGLGNAFRLPGLQKFLAEKLQLDVRKLQKFAHVEGDNVLADPVFANNILSFATVYGLALQGLKVSRLKTNLLPPDIQFARMIRAKKPWAVAAAAALLIGFAGTTLGYTMQRNALYSPLVEEARLKAEKLASDVKGWEGQWNTKNNEVINNETSIKSMMQGKDERLNWALLNRFVNESLPVPAIRVEGKVQSFKDGVCTVVGNNGAIQEITLDQSSIVLSNDKPVGGQDLKPGLDVVIVYQKDRGARKYWDNPAAPTAYFQFWARQAAGRAAEGSSADEGIPDLIQINLEAVGAMYTSDLKSYFARMPSVRPETKGDYKEGMPIPKQADAPPEGKGWVVELRGYTYNRGRREFVMDTLASKLADRAQQALAAADKADDKKPEKKDEKTITVPEKTGAEKKDDKKADEAAKKPAVSTLDPEPKKGAVRKTVAAHVSHVILFEYRATLDPDPGKFELIGTSYLPDLVSGSSWQSLLDGETGAVGPGGMSRKGAVTAAPGPGPTVPANGPMPPATPKTNGPMRTEFIILFVWQEPITFDDGGEAAAETAPARGMTAPMPVPGTAPKMQPPGPPKP